MADEGTKLCSVCGMELMVTQNIIWKNSGYCFGCGRVMDAK